MTVHTSVACKAYCSTANLGPGFDTFGLALSRYSDLVRVRWSKEQGIRIKVGGLFGGTIPRNPAKNSAGPPARELLRLSGVKGGLEIKVEKNIPPGLGLGSSGATAAACAKALDQLLELELPADELIRVASLGEEAVAGFPHTDNVAASLLGGFVVVYGEDPLRAFSIKGPEALSVVVVTPRIELPRTKTRLARGLIPRSVATKKAVLNIGRASAIAAGFARGDIDMIGGAMKDEIVEPFRETLIPAYKAVKKAALKSHASGVAISGAGPSLVAMIDQTRHNPKQVASAMVREFSKINVAASFFVTKPGPEARIAGGK